LTRIILLLLALNTATTSTEIALVQGTKVLYEDSWFAEKNEAEKILPAMKKALKKSRREFSDLDALFVVSGPGSFSGLRIGVTIMNALAFSCGIPVFSCNTFELFKARLNEKQEGRTLILIAGGGSTFALKLPGTGKIFHIDQQEFSHWLEKNKFRFLKKNVSFLLADLKKTELQDLQKKILSPLNWITLLRKNQLKTFGQSLKEVLKNARKFKSVRPTYLQKPTITKSKKPIFV
jgi:tRNA threonylcarbamoyl adenosine modification protein YeaZ